MELRLREELDPPVPDLTENALLDAETDVAIMRFALQFWKVVTATEMCYILSSLPPSLPSFISSYLFYSSFLPTFIPSSLSSFFARSLALSLFLSDRRTDSFVVSLILLHYLPFSFYDLGS